MIFLTINQIFSALFAKSQDAVDTEISEHQTLLLSREELPLRAEIFGIEQLQAHAKVLADWHKLAAKPRRDKLLSRLAENEKVLWDAFTQVAAVAARGQTVSPGGEWLVDNFYLIEEQIRTTKRHLPKTYSRQLPQLRNGPAAGLPRVYHIALDLIAHLDGRIESESTTRFIAAYQLIYPLQIGELWAVPIMLRLALIENIRRIAARIALGIKDRNLAESWAGQLIQTAEQQPANLILILADMARSNPYLSTAFVAEFSRQMQGKSPSLSIALTWVEHRLLEQGQSVEERIHLEAQQQAANQISMGNSIASLRVLGAIDWRDFVEGLSVIEQTLRQDPAGVYATMDFATRDRYRHVVEDLAKRSGSGESTVALQALALALQGAKADAVTERTAHVGYYLAEKGLPLLEARTGAKLPLVRHLRRLICHRPLTFYLGLGLLLTVLLSLGLLTFAGGTLSTLGWVVLLPSVSFAMGQLALGMVNWLVPLVVEPRMLPRLDFSHGIPPAYPAMVVIPTMLSTPAGAEELLDRLEVHYLSNRDDHLSFALLTDYKDAAQEQLPEDALLLQTAVDGIRRLNQRYGTAQTQPFFLFHRPRRWCPSEGKWIGYERKRGKLTEFNAVLRGGAGGEATARFMAIEGPRDVLPSIRYVITLDTDTELPRDAARKLVATMAHPLIRPQFNPRTGLVQEGYAILQPRVAVNLPSASRSLFVKLFAGEPGIDPYTHVVSDLYQDLFQEGSFIGKGIYEVDAFEKILGHRFPENRILSHDLLEGCYVRAGVVSDIQLYEDYPWNFRADTRRRHRWIRGDWQIASWIFPRIPGPTGRTTWNPLSALSRWKIADNLRRSLSAAALVMLLLLGWLVLPAPAIWTTAVLAVYLIPAGLGLLVELARKPAEFSLMGHLHSVLMTTLRQFGQIALTLIFLPYEALYSLDAVLRTMARICFTHRRLLEWETASEVQQKARNTLGSFLGSMLAAPLLALGVLGLMLGLGLPLPTAALPFLLLWIISPALACWISQPIVPQVVQLTVSQQELLRVVARQTWRFFDTFIGPEDHDLPPDNYQEFPVEVTAHRTSPTNIGLGILSTLAAYDFGYISAGELLDRTGKTLHTMDTLSRYRGHFYNWYDTRTLQPMPPLYVSTVDSGNLAGLLMTFRQGLLELPTRPLIPARAFEGIGDLVLLLTKQLRQPNPAPEIADPAPLPNLTEDLAWLRESTQYRPTSLAASAQLLHLFTKRAVKLEQQLAGVANAELRWAADALVHQSQMLLQDLQFLAPWLQLPIPLESFWGNLDPETQPTPPGSGTPEMSIQLAAVQKAFQMLDAMPTTRTLAELSFTLIPQLNSLLDDWLNADPAHPHLRSWLLQLRTALSESADRAMQRCTQCAAQAAQCETLNQMDFQFLYDKSREQMAIGFNVTERRRDTSFYDLLASESRLGSFVAIAQGQLPQESWFALGRNLTFTQGGGGGTGQTALISWSGSMFEYLMPLLVMPTYPDTLLDRTYQAVVTRQRQYGVERDVPWGISESGYNMTDAHLNYQYRAFGIPGLGFKRGLTDDLVVAPYASVMALMVDPPAACQNLERLTALGVMGRYGFYEAVDYTQIRMPLGQDHTVVRSYMSHHAGMSFLALAYQLLDRPMQRRFLADPNFKATELLLHERVPKAVPVYAHSTETLQTEGRNLGVETLVRVIHTPDTPKPEIHLLSNGRYQVMISQAGGGYSRWKDLAVTRWREDPTRDCWGSFCYIRDLEKRNFWSATHQPTLKPAASYETIFQQARAEFRRLDSDIETHTEISVSPEDDIELRRLTLTNRSRRRRTLELTSYAEVVIATPAADAAHPAFNNLFVQTELMPHHRAILCTRRPRSAPEHPPWMLHLMTIQGKVVGNTTYETDRSKFIGRGRTPENPLALEQPQLSDSQGAVLDPIVAIRQTVVLEPGESAKIVIVTGLTETREAALGLIEKYHDPSLAERVFEMAWTHCQVTLRQLNCTEADAQMYSRLAGSIIYPTRQFRAPPALLAKNRRGQSGLWGYSISGDLPIVLLRIGDRSNIDLVRQIAQAHAYWKIKGLAVDLILWNEDHSGYRQALQDQIIGLINAGPEAHSIDRPGGIFVRRADQISEEDRLLMQAVARVILVDTEGTFVEQVEKHPLPSPSMPRLLPMRRPEYLPGASPPPVPELQFFNGLGGFSANGAEYHIHTDPKRVTPAPWVNVLANVNFGTVVSESGSAYTWFQNAHECRLTPWSNDAVSDPTGEAFYLRDEETGEFWSPTPLPARGHTPYVTRHGMGYTVFEHVEQGIHSELSMYVALDAPVKFAVLKISNQSERARQITVAGYWEWVLGEIRAKSLMHIVTEVDPRTGALLARNPYNAEFGDLIAFVEVNDSERSITGDRTEFLGRNGTLANPAALGRRKLSGKLGAGLDPCAAMLLPLELADGQQRELVFIFGAGHNLEEVRHLIQRFRSSQAARKALDAVTAYWTKTLGAVQVETPDPAVNILTNGWLVYQTLACRMWARSGFYQSGGAYGFRDQLQDSLALVHTEPGLVREHLLRCAGHQFREGDVQHWWHPPAGRGVRTHFSDDFLWLALATARYVTHTGDTGVLEERINYLEGRPVKPEEESYYDLPTHSANPATLYEHCVAAIENGLKFGTHGLPLIGSGDWNDGMNLIGEHGQGESVWLAFFQYHILLQFAPLARQRGDAPLADRYLAQALQLQQNIELHGWDGQWYRRAYFDNGEPLGSATNPECQIDALPQSWAVIAGAGDPQRRAQAMAAVNTRLIQRDSGIIQLFTPPFDKSPLNPGYIKGYVPGVRENGGQYTHAAIWTTMAFALLGQSERAWELLALINPINHGATASAIATYKVEPYVMAADVYALPPHTGRGGWTWYTGSAGWMYQLILETLLGLTREPERLCLKPRLPAHWPGFQMRYHFRETCYHLHLTVVTDGPTQILVDGVANPDAWIKLVNDRLDHTVTIQMARPAVH